MIQLLLKPNSVNIFNDILVWFNQTYKKSYYVEVKKYNKEYNLLILNDFDLDYSSLFGIGNNYGRLNQKENNDTEPYCFIEKNKRFDAKFKIISEDDKLIVSVLDNYNRTYQSKIRVEKFLYDEVIFAELEAERIRVEDVFFLGCSFGVSSQLKRENGEIDW